MVLVVWWFGVASGSGQLAVTDGTISLEETPEFPAIICPEGQVHLSYASAKWSLSPWVHQIDARLLEDVFLVLIDFFIIWFICQ